MFDESIENNREFDGRQSFIVEKYYIAIDILKANLERRRKIYAELSNQIGCLGNLSDLANEEIRNKAEQLLTKYQTDLDDAFPEERVHLASFLKGNKHLLQESVTGEMSDSESEASRLLKLLKTCNVESIFPNVEIILRFFLSMAVTNCSGERSFLLLRE
jgi:hypothetical protein